MARKKSAALMLTRWSEVPLLFEKFCVIILRILILFLSSFHHFNLLLLSEPKYYLRSVLFMQRHQVIMDPDVTFCCFFSCGFRNQQFAIGSIVLCLLQCFLWRVVFPFPECFCLFNITPLFCLRLRAADFHHSRLNKDLMNSLAFVLLDVKSSPAPTL